MWKEERYCCFIVIELSPKYDTCVKNPLHVHAFVHISSSMIFELGKIKCCSSFVVVVVVGGLNSMSLIEFVLLILVANKKGWEWRSQRGKYTTKTLNHEASGRLARAVCAYGQAWLEGKARGGGCFLREEGRGYSVGEEKTAVSLTHSVSSLFLPSLFRPLSLSSFYPPPLSGACSLSSLSLEHPSCLFLFLPLNS